MSKKGSFFERLTGSHYYEEPEEKSVVHKKSRPNDELPIEDDSEGQLAVDVFQSPDEIIIEAMIPGVKVEDIDIAITREMVTLKGTRERHRVVEDDQFFFRELFWGSFSRTILLPQEIEPDQADAREKNGVLVITLPKSDKGKQHKLRVRSSSQG